MRHVVLGAGPLGLAIQAHLRALGDDVELHSIMGNAAYDMPGTEPATIDGTKTNPSAAIGAFH